MLRMIYNNIKKLDPSELTRLQRLVPFSRLEHMLILELDSVSFSYFLLKHK